MDMQSPDKRHKSETLATGFIASPVPITKDNALRLKESNRTYVELRYISTEAVSESDALGASPEGFQLCVLPHSCGTNSYFQNIIAKQIITDTAEFYVTALYSSVLLCMADLVMVPLYILDYHMRRLYLQKKQNAAQPHKYQALFVGKGKRKPFKGTDGDQIRYCFLLKAYMQLVREKDDESEDIEVRDMGSRNERLDAFGDLLQSSEDYLAMGMIHCGVESFDLSDIRNEALSFLEGEEKTNRDTGAHLFTQLFYQQRRTPLSKQLLQDTIFPPENEAVFQLGELSNLSRMGFKLLALADIESRLRLPADSALRLTSAAPTLVRAGVKIVKSFVTFKNNIEQSVEFTYGSLKATLGEGEPTMSIDLARAAR